MSKYSVLIVGMGKRGMHHAAAFNANPRFQVTGICDIDQKRLEDAAAKLGNPEFTPRNVQTREDRDRLVYGVEVAIPNPEARLRPGMPVEVAIDGTGK